MNYISVSRLLTLMLFSIINAQPDLRIVSLKFVKIMINAIDCRQIRNVFKNYVYAYIVTLFPFLCDLFVLKLTFDFKSKQMHTFDFRRNKDSRKIVSNQGKPNVLTRL